MPIDDDDHYDGMQRKRDLLCLVGRLVFGTMWPRSMALYLRISNRQMTRWATTYYEIPDVLPNGERLLAVLRVLLLEHKKDVDAALKKLPAVKEMA
jgi:hypothetical protein